MHIIGTVYLVGIKKVFDIVASSIIQDEIKSRLKSGNACYYSVQNLLSSSLLSKNLKIKI